MHRLPPQDITYFFRKEIDEERRLNHVREPLAPEGVSAKGINDLVSALSGDFDIRLIIGASVSNNGKSRYEALLLNAQNFPSSPDKYGLHMLSNEYLAQDAERNVVVKLTQMGIPADVKTKVLHYEGHGYVLHVRIVPDRRLDAARCRGVLQEYLKNYGVSARQKVH